MIQLQELFSLHFVIEFLRVLRGERESKILRVLHAGDKGATKHPP